MRRIALLCVLCITWLGGFAASAYGTSYQIRELSVAGTAVVGPSWANAINNSGRVAGVVYDSVTSYAAVTNSLGQWELLDEGFGLGINGSGQVVGYADGAALWDAAGNVTHLPLPEGALFSQGVGTNDAGCIVGECWLGTGHVDNYVAVWNGAPMPTILGAGCANGVSSSRWNSKTLTCCGFPSSLTVKSEGFRFSMGLPSLSFTETLMITNCVVASNLAVRCVNGAFGCCGGCGCCAEAASIQARSAATMDLDVLMART